MTEKQKITMESFVNELKSSMQVPPGAWTLREFVAKAENTISNEYARRKHQDRVKLGELRQGGPKNSYYWPA